MKECKIKKLLSFLTAFCLLLGCFPILAGAAVGDTVTVEEECTIGRNGYKDFIVNIRESGTYSLVIHALKGRRNVDVQLKIGNIYDETVTLIAGGNNSTIGTTEITGIELEATSYIVTITELGTANINFEKLVFTMTSSGTVIPTPEPEPEPEPTLPVLNEENVFSADALVDGAISFGSESEKDAYKLSVTAENTEGITFNVYVNNELAVSGANIENLGNYAFPVGDNTLKIESVGGEVVITEVKLTKYDPKEASSASSEINVLEPISDVLNDGFYDTSGAFNSYPNANPPYVMLEDTEWVRYKVNAAEAGNYLVYITYGTWNNREWIKIENETTNDSFNGILPASGITDYTVPVVTTKMDEDNGAGNVDVIIEMTAGENILKFSKHHNNVSLFNLKFELISNKVDTYAVYVGETPLLGTNKITPSADTMTIYFTNPVEDSSLSDKITLTDASGNKYPLSAAADGSKVNIELLKSLQPETEYTLSVSGVTGEKETMKNIRTYTFKTSEEKNNGVSVIGLTNALASYETVTASGKVSGSHGKGIAGRKVKMYLVKGSEKTLIKEFESGEDGEFDITAEIDREAFTPGKYMLYFEPQYDIASTATKNIVYVDSNIEADIKDAFKHADDVTKVQQAFSDYSDYMPFNANADVITVGTNLYNHFISYEITNMNDFYSYYDKMYMFEGLRTSKSTAVLKGFLYNQSNCEKIGVDYNKISLIENEKEAFLTAVMGINETDYDKYIEVLQNVVYDYLLKESGKENVSISMSDISVTLGQSFTQNIEASLPQTLIKKAELIMEFSSAAAIDGTVTVNSDFKGTAKKTADGNKITIEYTYDELANVKKLFSVKFIAAAAGSYTVNYSGKLYFDYNEYELTTDITSGDFNLTIKSPGSKAPTGGGGGTVSSDSSFKPTVKPDKEDEEKTETVKEETVFNDLSGYEWAEESIFVLTKKGIISKAEDKKFRPGDNITREEFVKMIVCLLGLNNTITEQQFTDVPQSHWAYEYVSAAVENGIVAGMGDGTFGLGTNITREQMAAIVARILDKYGYTTDISSVEEFADKNEISDYAKDSVLKIRNFGIINGVGENMFAPKFNALRAEAAKIIYGLSEVVGL